MPVAVHGVKQETVCDFATAAGATLPGQGARPHRRWLAAASGIHHRPSLVVFECNGCKVVGFREAEGAAGGQVAATVPQSAGRRRTHRGAPSASGDPSASALLSAHSKWSYQIVFPLDAPRFTAAAAFISLEQKESIAVWGLRMPLISSGAEKVRCLGEKKKKKR